MRQRLFPYVLSLAALAAAVALRWIIDPILQDALPLVTLFGAVGIAVWSGGFLPAFMVVILGYLSCNYLFVEPRGTFTLTDSRSLIGIGAYLLTCSIIIGFGEAMRRARGHAEVRQKTLEVTLLSMGDAVITVDKLGLVTSLNPMAESLVALEAIDAIGQPLEQVFRIVNESTRAVVENPVRRALRDGTPSGLENHTLLIRKDGTEIAIDDSAAPIRDAKNEIIGAVLIFRDITPRRQLERQLNERHGAARLLASIVESSDDAIVSKSLEGIIQSWNDGATRLFGYAAEEAIGKHISLIIPGNRAEEEEHIISRIKAGERVAHFDTVRARKDGHLIHISLTVSPVIDDSGRVIGASKIAREITDRKEAEERIYTLMAELKEADRRKDEFLAVLSHELRNPLAPMTHMLEILKHPGSGDDSLKQARETMERQVSQLVRLVDDLIDVSRITQGKITLRKERVDLVSAVQQSIESCRPLAESAKHEVKVTLPEEPIWVKADPVRLVQIFANIVGNACKYTGAGGRIGVTLERHGSDAVVTIKDNGIGIPPNNLGRVFDMFAQVDPTSERSQRGLGIGLTLVKRLTEMHGGTVEAKSDGVGLGSEFRVHLPVLLRPSGVGLELPTRATERAMVSPRRILVVDDNTDAATSLVRLLRLSGHEMAMAHDGAEAISVAEKFRPEVILLDIGLPKLNGTEVCRRIREQAWGKKTVIVALTGWSQEEDRRKSREAGFDAHMVKPLNLDALIELLAEKEGSESVGVRE